MAPVAVIHQRRDFKVLGSSPEQNGCEIGVKKNIMLQRSPQNWWPVRYEVREVNMDFFFFKFLLTYSYSAAETCVQQGWKHELFPIQWQKWWRRQSWCTAFIQCRANGADMDTPHWEWNTHTPTHTMYTQRLRVFVQRHRWTLNASVCVRVWESAWFKAISSMSDCASKWQH